MRTYGVYMIITAIAISFVTFVIEMTFKPSNINQIITLAWFNALSPLLIFSGIGFILYDIAAKHGIEEPSRSQEKLIKERTDIREAVLEYPRCNRKSKFPISMIGSIVECSFCKETIKLEGIHEADEKDEGVKWK